MNISTVINVLNKCDEKIRKKRASIARLERQVEKLLKQSSWIDIVIHPIAEELSTLLKLPVWEVLGPFGIYCETSIYFAESKEELSKSEVFKTITFRPNNSGEDSFKLHIVNTSENSGAFVPNSIGAINGGNHPSIDATEMDVKTLLKYVG